MNHSKSSSSTGNRNGRPYTWSIWWHPDEKLLVRHSHENGDFEQASLYN